MSHLKSLRQSWHAASVAHLKISAIVCRSHYGSKSREIKLAKQRAAYLAFLVARNEYFALRDLEVGLSVDVDRDFS